MALAFVPVSDVIKDYSTIVDDFDEEDYELLDYFERVWVEQKKGRGLCPFKYIYMTYLIEHKIYSGNQRGKLKFSLHKWNTYERVIKDLPRSNSAVDVWHSTFNHRVSIKHPSITKLAKCIIREQSRFEIDIERLRAGEQPKKKNKVVKGSLNRTDVCLFTKRISSVYIKTHTFIHDTQKRKKEIHRSKENNREREHKRMWWLTSVNNLLHQIKCVSAHVD